MSDRQCCGYIHVAMAEGLKHSPEGRMLIESMAALIGYGIELENTSVTDSLTGLYNRRYLRKLLEGDDTTFGVMFIDLNDFKVINDRFGHEIGDRLLIQALIG
ncbi:GGDEF domain-containing protein [Paenibacillus sp. NEAU-GSW1]|uniref:GGDEF domain-containing protein n=1 Tax=Paenibacillus sp. NEAU-GSW1 TaxID=2682486 RepID=UPI001C12CCFF|nr:GGDEF domain-containing protein [Paenibacillus sp. NEAU-GSW1]